MFCRQMKGSFKAQCNIEMIDFAKIQDKAEIEAVRTIHYSTFRTTDSPLALDVLAKWEQIKYCRNW